jgi:hypothetical protein
MQYFYSCRDFITTNVFKNAEIKSFARLTGGLTNMLYKVSVGDNVVLVRVNGIGTENMIDRDREIIYMATLSEYGLAPKIHATYENGSIYDYKEGEPLQPKGFVNISNHFLTLNRITITCRVNCKRDGQISQSTSTTT